MNTDADRNPKHVGRINWTVTRTEMSLIVKIVERAEREMELPPREDRTTRLMDIEACHANGCPLDLPKFLAAPPFDFAHDFAGIQHHIDRETGKLKDCFLPRCAKKQE